VRRPLLVEGLLRSLEDLAAIGEKRAGSAGAHRAAAYLSDRFAQLGLAPQLERFEFPRHEVLSSSLEIAVGGQVRPFGCEVLEASGAGRHRGPVTYVGRADDVSRRISGMALVARDTLLHRSTQLVNVAHAGASAMLMASAAPGNLHQIGSVRRAWEAAAPIPALSLGARDAELLREALAAGHSVEAAVEVAIRIGQGNGQNVVARIDGERSESIVIGAHYDTWYIGSTDNGAGIATLLELAARWRTRSRPQYTLIFVCFDGEELALYGGYDFLRRHLNEPILAVLDFETPSSHGAQAYGLARSSHAVWERVLPSVTDLFAVAAPMSLVPELFGGVIPTDIQGLYRAGTPVLSTAGDGPYYHTSEDTPDKVDLHRLAEVVDAFDRMLQRLMQEPTARYAGRDTALWRAEVELSGNLDVSVSVRDHAFLPQPGVAVEAVLFEKHFFEVATSRAQTDGEGRVTLPFAPRPLQPPSWVHVTAGRGHPLVEVVVPITQRG
jgi:hypothetical protein